MSRRAVAMLLLFALTLFSSAFLLFMVQPLMGKLIVPLLGGFPSVWNTCMVFFQAALLAGYAYAHWSTSWLGERKQALPHLVLLLCAFVALPISISDRLKPAGDSNPIAALLLLLGALDRTAVLHYFHHGTASAKVVQQHRPSRGERSLLSLRRQQCRQHPRPDQLPSGRRTAPVAGIPVLPVVHWLCPARAADRSLCSVPLAFHRPQRDPGEQKDSAALGSCSAPGGPTPNRLSPFPRGPHRSQCGARSPGQRRTDFFRPGPALDRPGFCAVQPHARGHHLYDHRHCFHPPPLDPAVGSVLAQLHPGVLAAAAGDPQGDGPGVAGAAAAAGLLHDLQVP